VLFNINIHLHHRAGVVHQVCGAEGGLASVIACLKAGPNQSAAQHAANLLQVRTPDIRPDNGVSVTVANRIDASSEAAFGITWPVACLVSLRSAHGGCLSPAQALARHGAAGAVEAADGVPPLVRLLEGGPVSAGTLAAVLCVNELIADSRYGVLSIMSGLSGET